MSGQADRTGISGQGGRAEAIYRLATGAAQPERKALGDAVLDGHYVEVKKASNDTLNQVRAVKYSTLVALEEGQDGSETWYVVPAWKIVCECASKSRGQHCENPFETATLSLRRLSDFAVSGRDALRQATLKAATESDGHPELKKAMDSVLERCRALAKESVDEVQAIARARGLLDAPDPEDGAAGKADG